MPSLPITGGKNRLLQFVALFVFTGRDIFRKGQTAILLSMALALNNPENCYTIN